MVEAILKDKKKILPCSVFLQGEYGIYDLFVGVPVKLGARGVEQIIQITLTADENAALQKVGRRRARARRRDQGVMASPAASQRRPGVLPSRVFLILKDLPGYTIRLPPSISHTCGSAAPLRSSCMVSPIAGVRADELLPARPLLSPVHSQLRRVRIVDEERRVSERGTRVAVYGRADVCRGARKCSVGRFPVGGF